MKKSFFYSLLVLICFTFFSGQSNYKSFSASENNSTSKLSSGWTTILTDTTKFVSVYFKTENLGCIFTGTYPVKRTTNGGNSWGYGIVPYLTGTDGGVYFNGSDIFMAGYNEIGSLHYGILFRSSNMGINWDTADYFTKLGGVSVHYIITSIFKNIGYLGIAGGYEPIWRKTNNGGYNWYIHTWILPPSGSFDYPSSISYADTNVIYGVANSQSIGKCVTGVTNGHFNIIKYGAFTKVCVVDSSNIIALAGSKMIKSTDAGINWDSTIFPVRLNSISFPDLNTGYMTGAQGKIFKSTNKGATWITQATPTTDSLVDCCFLNALTGYVIGYNGTLLKTNNGGGNNFTISGFVRYSDNNQPATDGYVKAFKLDVSTGNIIIFDSAQIQNDGSYTLSNVPQDSLDIGVYPNSTTNNDWVITYYPSTTYWQGATTLYPTGNLTNINVGAIRLTSTTNNNSVNGKVMRLTDAQIGNLKDAVLYAKSGNTFVRCGVSDGNGVYHLPSLPAGNLKIICNRIGFTNDSAMVTVTSSSNIDSINFHLYRVSVGIKQISSVVPSEYKLYQNYPNPFNPSTIIRYQITPLTPPFGKGGTGGFVTLKVYDILGKEVATLVNNKQIPGVYEVTWEASQYPSGIYFYRLISGDFSETKKMLMIK